jgi:WXG100 family type VII secretion target
MFQLILAYKLLAEAVAEIGRQVQAINDVMQNSRQTAEGLKDKWTGDDADSFQAEIAGGVTPKMGQLAGTCSDFINRINQAQERMRRADQEAKSAVDQLEGVFRSI